MNFPLQPLRIPSGWLVDFNTFSEVDPSTSLGPDAALWRKQDLLQAVHLRRDRVLDLGWYPDGDVAAGAYRVVLHAGDLRGPLLHEFESRERLAVVAEVERLFADVAACRL